MFLKILKKAVPVPRLEKFDRFLFVGPHPDDIEVACGGTVARLKQLGKHVTFVVVTDGSVGSIDQTLTGQQLAETRRQESLKSAKILGVEEQDVVFLNFGDGNNYNVDEVTRSLVQCIVKFRPDVVLCPDHTVRSETHPDHINVGRCCTLANFYASWKATAERMGSDETWLTRAIAYYYTDRPNTYVGVSKTFQKKMQAISCHKSQFTQADIKSFNTYFRLRGARFGLRCGKRNAEGFCALSNVHQHCFPEASEF